MNKKEFGLNGIGIFIAFIVFFIFGWSMGTFGQGDVQIHPDGYLWVYMPMNDTPVYESEFNHDQIQCLCQYLKEFNYDCDMWWPGCGANNCECWVNSTTNIIKISEAVDVWKRNHNGHWVQGEGVICE